jgi:hypothetical protein
MFSLLHALPEAGDADGGLAEDFGFEDHVVVHVVEEAIDDYHPRPCSPEVQRPRRSDAEILAGF